MLTLLLVIFPVILLLGALAVARLERSLDRPSLRRIPAVAPIEDPSQAALAAAPQVIR
jgi:hypothetical protein